MSKNTKKFDRGRKRAFRNFTRWLKENGATFPDLYFKEYGGGERGVHSTTAIPEGKQVVKIPLRLLITEDLAQTCPYAKAFNQRPSSSDIYAPHLALITLYMLDTLEDPDHLFAPYYDILPRDVSNFPHFWGKKDRRLLENSEILGEVDQRLERFLKDYDQLSDILPGFSDRFTAGDYLWLRTLVGSRNFRLPIHGKSQSTMVPLGDMLNHNVPADVRWGFDPQEDGFTMVSKTPIAKGAQVMDSYGLKPNTKYFLHYGFALENIPQDTNTVHVKFTLDPSDPSYHRKKDLSHGGKVGAYLASDINQTEGKRILDFLRVAHASPEELEKQARKQDPGRRNEMAARVAFADEISQKLDRYPRTLQKNMRLLRRAKPFSNSANALRFIIGEQIILHKTLDQLLESIENIHANH